MAKKGSNNFILQGSILALAGIFVRLIGLLYRVPLTNIIGDAGIGVYSTAYSVYNILLLISSYSLPLAVSRLVASKLAQKQYKNTRKLLIISFGFAFISGSIMGSICYFGADAFAGLMKMPQAAFAIKTLAPTIFIMAFLGVLRGYFQGKGTMIPTAFSQIIEQIVNAAVSLIAGYLLFVKGSVLDSSHGLNDYYSASYGAAGGTIGTGAGAFTALAFFVFLYIINRPRDNAKLNRDIARKTDSNKKLTVMLVMTICPVLLSTTVYQVSTIIDQAVFAAYEAGDYSATWGAFNGKYMLLVHVPTAIASAVGSALIPSLAAAAVKNDNKVLAERTGLAVKFNMYIAIPATVGLAVLAKPVMNMLFSTDNTFAAYMMILGSTAIMFTALSTTTNSVLQGIGNIWIPVRNSLISLVSHVIILCILLWGMRIHIYGVVLANICFYVIMSILNSYSLSKKIGYKQEWYKSFISPLISSAVMGLIAYIMYKAMYSITGSNGISVLVTILIAIFIYLEALVVSRGIDENDLGGTPFGRKICKVLKKLHLMR